MVKAIHTMPIKGFLNIIQKDGKSQVKIVITAAERQEETRGWLSFAAGVLVVKPLKITNLNENAFKGVQEIVLEQHS